MLQSLRNIWEIPDLRKRILFTLGMLAIYRLGSHVPTPGINAAALIDFFEQNKANWFGLVDMFSGGNLAKVTIFALGIMPYISASIILQLLTVVWPFLEKLSKEGELGKRKITQYTRYGTVLLSIVQSLAIVCGKAMIEEAKITGITPLVFTRRGRWVVWPPAMRRPTTRFAYCTVMRRWPRSMKMMAPITATMAATSRSAARRLSSDRWIM